jgi:hypothetical protein
MGALSTKFLGLASRTGGQCGGESGLIRLYIIERFPRHSWPAKFIVKNMGRSITTRAYVVAWLLCVVLTGLSFHSSHCDRCDRPYLRTSSVSQHPLANHQLPTEPDTCNGICWCCGFHGLPNAGPVLTLANYVTFDVWLEPVSVVLAPRSTIFRPPRTAISS